MRYFQRFLPVVFLLPSFLAACGGGSSGAGPVAPATRSWRMGFFPTPPRLDTALVLQGVDLMSERAEFLHLQQELPWMELLSGTSADALVEEFRRSRQEGYMALARDVEQVLAPTAPLEARAHARPATAAARP